MRGCATVGERQRVPLAGLSGKEDVDVRGLVETRQAEEKVVGSGSSFVAEKEEARVCIDEAARLLLGRGTKHGAVSMLRVIAREAA